MIKTQKRILVITAVAAERDAIMRGVRGDDRFEVIAAGVGTAVAAAQTAKVLTAGNYGLVISAGIGGGFAGRAAIGTVVVADEIVAADLGAETPEGFISLDELGFGSARIKIDRELAAKVTDKLSAAGITSRFGTVLTVSTATGTSETAERLAARVPEAAAEAMEGYGVAVAARLYGVPVLEIRAISNPVGPRDRAAWRIGEALESLQAASSILPEVL
ncbi:hypothetical protein SD71_06090 [Cohnella kolymensis]|uniref:Futalosine hydrolase n=1 Tax=Cohnella kolymensis TaxID=1590652 RepID=A0ABR5A6D0_9BACL|nr:futalosine hydrolase [Cohnella kolymensis]KIL36594.1 hypothetical protein SD71_06090 [Cohnella kolymensis]